ncbi:MAG: succinate dehydrogenase, cytochrome b556 subunit, partial [Rhodospirillales bacterium]
MSSESRPLSPHLQVYRPQITSMLSILHRIT